jgi:hypothetical protein
MKREVSATPTWRNALTCPPPTGSTVLALTKSGVLISCQWSSKTSEYCVGWIPYPKISPEIKAILSKQWEPKEKT